jgi:hypothetical protein
MNKHQIIVGNIGTVYDGNLLKEAMITYSEYLKQSKAGYGKASGESVVWFIDGEPFKEYIGTIDSED